MATIRKTFDLVGIVQGVGFRPTLHRLAVARGLGGTARNRTGSVRLVLEGTPETIADFMAELPRLLPAQARLDRVVPVAEAPLTGPVRPFAILASESDSRMDVVIPADLALCEDCAAEILNPADRRYGYPFTTCTLCGPRYTVVHATPYDRERTTLSVFPLCPDCEREYRDPTDRRFHAESIACPACGPTLALYDRDRQPVPGSPLRETRRRLAQGALVAVRGLGGYLLACDAMNGSAIETLRHRKTRPDKPFAVMARSLETLRRHARIRAAEARLLRSARAPIVLLDWRRGRPACPRHWIGPDTDTVGAMLPTTALHTLLFEPLADDPVPPFELLIMTSGNRGGEPICLSNEEAFDRLADMADVFLTHNREINLRNDDSIAVLRERAPQLWRRARGYAPDPVVLARPLRRAVLAMGAELKNAIAVAQGDKATLSPHIGDLESPEAVASLEHVAVALPKFLHVRPHMVAVDLHLDMQATRTGRALAAQWNVPVFAVQHHHAHAVACLAEHRRERGLALVFDGTGWGPDERIWGAELLEIQGTEYRRLATFKPVPLPGGNAAVRQPVRQLAGRWFAAGITPDPALLQRMGIADDALAIWRKQCEQGVNAPHTHAAGRLFDVFSALLGFAPANVTYEGQAAIRLETAARQGRSSLNFPFRASEENGMLVLDWADSFRLLSEDRYALSRDADLAMAAHRAVAQAALRMIEYGLSRSRERTVALSGGVFMNGILTRLTTQGLRRMKTRVLLHRQTPPNDGGIALGQAVVAGRHADAGIAG